MDVFAAHGLSCPLTLGRRTTMSETAWLKACAVALKPRPAFSGGRPPAPPKICGLCKGEHRPNELEIIEMANTCDACGEIKALKANRGKQICSTCTALYAAAAHRPELMLQVLRELKPELLDERLPAQDNVSELERQLYHAQERVTLAEEQKQEMLNSIRAALQCEDKEYDHDLVAVAERRMLMLAKLEQLYNQADDQVQRMQCEYTELLEKKTKPHSADSALLDLALDALKGEITGLKAERIEALRGMA